MIRKQLLLLSLLSTTLLWAETQIPLMKASERLTREKVEEVRQSMDAALLENAHAVTFAEKMYVEYQPDGRSEMWADIWALILTEQGAKEWDSVPMSYREGDSYNEFHEATIYRADGTVETLDLEKHVTTVTSNRSNAENIYDQSMKSKTLTFPAVHVGDVIHLTLAYQTIKPRIDATFSDMSIFESTSGPTIYSEYVVLEPEELPLKSVHLLKEVPGTVKASVENLANGKRRYSWVAQNVPQVFAEPDMPEEYTQLQRVMVSTFGSWHEVSKWYWDLCTGHMEMTPAIREKTKELIANAKTPHEKLEALHGFVAQEIRYMGIIAEDKAPGYAPHDIGMTFDNRYGVCRDKGVLLVAMLREAGFNAFPVLISAGTQLAKEVPLAYFNHAIVSVDFGTPGNPDYYLVDPTDATSRAELPAYLSNCTYLVCRPEGETLLVTKVPTAEENLMAITTDAEIDAAGTLVISAKIDFGGVNDTFYRSAFVRATPDRLRQTFDGVLKSAIPGAEIESLEFSPKNPADISQPLQMTLRTRVPGFAVVDKAGHAVISLPFLSRSLGAVNFVLDSVTLPKREFDLEITSTCAIKEVLTLRGMHRLGKPAMLPQNTIEKANDGAAYALTVQQVADDTYVFTREMALSKRSYTPDDYLALRRLIKTIAHAEALCPLFVRQNEQDADVMIQKSVLDVKLFEDPCKVNTHVRSEKRVMSYQGKRAIAEEKLYYTPAYETLKLRVAEVQTVTGDILAVSEKEKNLLDVTGAATAPRYDFEKELVISLPAVDVGAVTTLDYAITSQRALPATGRKTFGSRYPIEHEVFSLTVPMEKADELILKEMNFNGVNITKTITEVDANLDGQNDHYCYTWEAKNLPAIRGESNTPSAYFFNPTITYAWKDAHPAVTLPGVIETIDAALAEAQKSSVIQALAREIDASVEDMACDAAREEALLQAVVTMISKKVRVAGVAWHRCVNNLITTPETVYTEGYGNRMDVLVLQMAVLRALDIECDIAFACDFSDEALATPHSQHYLLNEVPRWSVWTQAYIRLADGRLMGDEDEFDAIGVALVEDRKLFTREGEVAFVQREDLKGRAYETVTYVIDEKGTAVITQESKITGLTAGLLRRTKRDYTPETYRRAMLANADALVPGSTPHSLYQISDTYPVVTRQSVEATQYANVQDHLMSIPLRNFIGAVYAMRGVERKNPIWQDGAHPRKKVLEFWLPKGATILSAPEPFSMALPGGGHVTLDRKVFASDNGLTRITYTLTAEAKDAMLESWYYPTLIEFDRRLSAPSMSTLNIRLKK